MRIWILSDLHLDFGPIELPAVAADLVVLAGDLSLWEDLLPWVSATFPGMPVVLVLGNHDYYGQELPGFREALQRRARGSHLHLLENEEVCLGGIVFLGCTLWTDFGLHHHPMEAMWAAGDRINDFKHIRFRASAEDPYPTRLEPADSYLLHQESVRWLETRLAQREGERKIIVTHHSPSLRSVARDRAADPLTPAFTSNLEPLIERYSPEVWIHGHIHERADYQIGRSRILCNPRGYLGIEDGNGFDPGLVIEI